MSDQAIAQLLQLEQQVRKCETKTELAYVMVNMTRSLVAYEQGVLLLGGEHEKLKTYAISDIALVDRTTPFCAWFEQVAQYNTAQSHSNDAYVIDSQSLPEELRADFTDFSPPNMLWLPVGIPSKNNERLGVMCLSKSIAWTERELGLLKHLASSYGHALQLFRQSSGMGRLWEKLANRRIGIGLITIVVAAGFIPINLTVLAPGEIIAKDPVLVTAPIAGSVKEVLVKPGDAIAEGDQLVQMETIEYQGQLNVAQRELDRVLAELRTTEQAGYVDRRRKSELLELESSVELKTIERDFYEEKLNRTRIMASAEGIAVFDGPDQWQGRPVVVGERVLSIADPNKIHLEVMLPVKDAISLTRGDKVTFFMDTDPLNPMDFNVLYSTYEPTLTPDQIVAYRLIAEPNFDEGAVQVPRIGLRGTAKMYGAKVSLAYYLLRRPITFIRQHLGL